MSAVEVCLWTGGHDGEDFFSHWRFQKLKSATVLLTS